jgi:uncharacterized protein (TIGR02466 family)
MPSAEIFPSLLYTERLIRDARAGKRFQRQLLSEIEDVSQLDEAGQLWSKTNYRNGFTSYASANCLHRSSTTFSFLESKIDAHVKKFAKDLELDLQGGKLRMSTCWVNVMPPNTHHSLHLHPLSVISGTYYVSVPRGASSIKFEDPRLSLFMHRPPVREKHSKRSGTFVELAPEEGSVVLFESWLRHEVPMNTSRRPRISVSFNYEWE